MIRFFRRIRQRLLHEGRLVRYLIYAFGEILLVVIGILIALQINNWNESNQRKHKEIEVLTDIRTSLESDLQNEIGPLLTRLTRDSQRINLLYYHTQQAQITRNPYLKKGTGASILTHELDFVPHETVYKTIESYGVDLISNKDMRNNILAIYERHYPHIKNRIANKMTNIRDYGRPLLRTKFKDIPQPDPNRFELIDLDIYDDPVFWNFLRTAERNNSDLYNALQELQILVEDVIMNIDESIQKRN